MKSRLTLFSTVILALFITSQSFSQVNFQPATLKDATGETFKGWVDFRQWNINPKTIRFKEKADGDILTLTVNDVIYFEITEKEKYVTAIVTKDMRPVTINELKINQSDKFVKDTVFLRQLFESPELSLYSLYDSKQHFYIKEPNNNYEELIFKVEYFSNDQGQFTETKNIFRDQLKRFILNNPNYNKLEKKLNETGYEEYEIINFLTSINPQTQKKVSKAKPIYFVSAGSLTSNLKAAGQTGLKDHNFPFITTPQIGVGVDFNSNRNFSDFVLRFEAQFYAIHYKGNYIRTNYYGQKIDEHYSLKMNTFSPSISILYNFIRTNSNKIYAGVKAGINLSSYPENVLQEKNLVTNEAATTSNYIDYEKVWMNAELQTGIITRKKIGVNASVRILGTLTNFISIPISARGYSLTLSYRF